jgi:hypothetical protein
MAVVYGGPKPQGEENAGRGFDLPAGIEIGVTGVAASVSGEC